MIYDLNPKFLTKNIFNAELPSAEVTDTLEIFRDKFNIVYLPKMTRFAQRSYLSHVGNELVYFDARPKHHHDIHVALEGSVRGINSREMKAIILLDEFYFPGIQSYKYRTVINEIDRGKVNAWLKTLCKEDVMCIRMQRGTKVYCKTESDRSRLRLKFDPVEL